MGKQKNFPVGLTLAGSDSGGGAGVQADLKTFAALGVHGTCAITCLTAQNPARVTAIDAVSPKMVQAQITAVFEELPPAAAKTGMLFSAPVIRAVARAWHGRKCPLVVDPVMIATSGARLLRPDAIRALTHDLFPLAKVITPNVPEAEALLGSPIRSEEDLQRAARELNARFGCAVLVKGGHLHGSKDSADAFFDGSRELLFAARRIHRVKTHGTGCTYSAAITAHLARGEKLVKAVELAKHFVTHAIAGAVKVHGHDVLAYSSCSH